MFQNLIPTKLTRAILAAVLFIAAALPSQALQSGDFTYTYQSIGIVITGYTGTGGVVTIPSWINMYPSDPYGWGWYRVVGIGENAFQGKTTITSVTIPDSVAFIESQAFGSCSGLTSVTIPSSVTYIGQEAFYLCTSLTSVVIPNRVTSIGQAVFYGCYRLTSVTIPNSVTSIGYYAFSSSGLTSVTISNSVTNIGDFAFDGCGMTSVTIPNSVTSIGSNAFSGCSRLTSLTIDSGVTSIGRAAFERCRGLTSVTIPNSVTSIGSYAFSQCTGLTSVTIDSGVTSIGEAAFERCTSLTSVAIPNSVTSIGGGAFNSSYGLTSMTIPSSVTSIGYYAFGGCGGLTSVYFQGNAPSVGSNSFTSAPATVYYRAGTTGWGTSFSGRPTVQFGGITSQPVNITTLQGTSATFTVTLIGATSYQWLKNGVNIPLATSSTLILSNVQQADATNYSVIVSDPAGNLTSNTATLTVIPDTDLDGLSDAEEASLGTNPNNSDSDGDGLSDRAEIQVYLSNALVKDTDSDGFEDGFEVSTGFNPALASSSPDSVSAIDNAVRFRFNAGLGLSYRIEESPDLQTWTTLESPIVGAGVEVTRYYPVVGHPKRYFRVKRNS